MNRSVFTYSLLLFTLIFFAEKTNAQIIKPAYPWKVDTTLIVRESRFSFRVPENHRPQWQTLQITRNSRLLQQEIDYRIHRSQTIRFMPYPSIEDTLRIVYNRLPVKLKRTYTLFEAEKMRTDDSTQTIQGNRQLRQINIENPFTGMPPGLSTSGSIMRGVKVGSNRDFTLNSGLNLELSGMITDNVEIIGALTDEATPIQPEGNTQTLEEIDKVYVQFRSPYVDGTVGDLNLTYQNSEFADLSRKLQGLSLRGQYGQTYLGATVAATRGFFNSMQFIGQEGNQGPYQLTATDGSQDIIVLAGTEKVFINGEPMVRGESNDYTIEYGNGQITFTNQRLITSESRIEIDFEYFPAVQQYNRNVYSVENGAQWFDDQLQLDVRYYREADNPQQSLEEGGELSAEDKSIIRQAGDDPIQAFTAGARLTPDSSGSYAETDTVYNNTTYTIYKYVGDNNGSYRITFSFVGKQRGSYTRDRLGVYRWIGPQRGDYEPVQLLPLPASHDVTDVRLTWQPISNIRLTTESALSRYDKNTLSSVDDDDNMGGAAKLHLNIADQALKLGQTDFGRVTANINARYVHNRFQSIDRLNRPDYQRYWNVLQPSLTDNREKSIQTQLNYRPIDQLSLQSQLGYLAKKEMKSKRWQSQIDFDRPSLFTGKALYTRLNSRLSRAGVNNTWQRYRVNLQKEIWKWTPRVFYRGEQRKNIQGNTISGFQYDHTGMQIDFTKWKYFTGHIATEYRQDKVYDAQDTNQLLPQAATYTHRLDLQLKNLQNTNASVQLTRRSKNYTRRFEAIKVDTLKLLYADASVQDTVWQDRKTNLAELKLGHQRWKSAFDFNMLYRISTEQTALKEKIYLDVGESRGNLRFDEDLQEYVPDPDGKYILFVLPSGNFRPITNLESAFRLRLDGDRYWDNPSGGWQSFLNRLSSESSLRIEEESGSDDLYDIYLLNVSSFQNAQTIRGVIQYDQDLYIMRRNRNLSFRLRFKYDQSRFNQFLDAGENEDRLNRTYALRSSWRINSRFSGQSEATLKSKFRYSAASPIRNRDITGYYGEQRLSYRPFTRWEFGLEGQYGREINDVESYPLQLWYVLSKFRIDYAIPGKGRISGEYSRQHVNVFENPLDFTIPFEMARGKKEGLSQLWQLRAEYTVAKNIVFTFFYNGRDESQFDRIIHSGQAEIRAFF
ncbi:MAG: hypothetical protein GF313_08420 [Caldithrix sp.]|nr:hypothetical protein [Caldithrix sp.]